MKLVYFLFCLAFLSNSVVADTINPNKPFAEKHVVLQVSDNDVAKFSLALDIANNLIRHYESTDNIDIQIVTFAGGVHMLKKDTENKTRIESLMASEVRFIVCLNTIDSIERTKGNRPEILDGVIGVQTGVAYMLDEIEKGYVHINP